MVHMLVSFVSHVVPFVAIVLENTFFQSLRINGLFDIVNTTEIPVSPLACGSSVFTCKYRDGLLRSIQISLDIRWSGRLMYRGILPVKSHLKVSLGKIVIIFIKKKPIHQY